MEDHEALREFCTLTLKQRLVEDQFAQSRALHRATHIAAGDALADKLTAHPRGVVVTDPVSGKRVMVRHKNRPVTHTLKPQDLDSVAADLQDGQLETEARSAQLCPTDRPFHGCQPSTDPGVATLAGRLFAACAPLCFTTGTTLEVADPLSRFTGDVVDDTDNQWLPHIDSLRQARRNLQAMRAAKPKTYTERLGAIGKRCMQAYGRVGGCMALQVQLGGKAHTFFMQQRTRYTGVKPLSKSILYNSIAALSNRALTHNHGKAVQYVLSNLVDEVKRRRFQNAREEPYLTVVRKCDRERIKEDDDIEEIDELQ